MLRSAITRCHWSSLRGVDECTVSSTGPLPTSKEKETTVGAGEKQRETLVSRVKVVTAMTKYCKMFKSKTSCSDMVQSSGIDIQSVI